MAIKFNFPIVNRKGIILTFSTILLTLFGVLVWNAVKMWVFEKGKLRDEVELLVKQNANDVLYHNSSIGSNYALMESDDAFDEKMAFVAGATLNQGKIRVYFENSQKARPHTKGDTTNSLKINKDFLQKNRVVYKENVSRDTFFLYSVIRKALKQKQWDVSFKIVSAADNNSKIKMYHEKTQPFLLTFTNPELYRVVYEVPDSLVFARMLTFVCSSALIILLLIMGFVFYWRSYLMQAEIAGFREMFFSNITHELKTPLTSLQTILRSAYITGEDYALRKDRYLDAIVELDRIKLLVEKVLSLGRMNKEQLNLNREVAALDELIQQSTAVMKSYANAAQATITTECGKSIYVSVDRALFISVATAIIDNAIRHNHSERPEVNISVKVEKEHVRILFCDNGPGIETRYKEKIFQPFFRIDNGVGSGLGLSFANEVVRLHGGSVIVTDNMPQGSCFTIMLTILHHEL